MEKQIIMKKIYSIILCGAICLFGATSCVNEEADIFDLSPAERLNKIVADYTDQLISSENGWVMEYFPTENTEGYIYLMKFGKGGEVIIAGSNKWLGNKYREETSLFSVLTDNGPVLSLSSYNKIFHLFAFPADPNGQDDDLQGLGLQGDYEFVIMNSTDDQLEMRGKKRNTYINMYKLPADVVWETYMGKIAEMNSSLFDVKVPIQYLDMSGEAFEAYNGATGIFSFLLPGEDLIAEGRKCPFITTSTGVRLYKPFTSNGISVQNFAFSADKSSLVSQENANVKITGPSAISVFNDEENWINTNFWKVDATDLGGVFATSYANLVANCKEKYKEDFDSFSLRYQGARRSRTLSFKSGNYSGSYDLQVTVTEGSNNQITFIDKGTSDRNGTLYRTNIGGFDEFIKALTQGDFELVPDSPIMPTSLRLVSTSNPANWVKVILN